MKYTPIIFTADSVRAILEGRKTQTRRVMKPQFPLWVESVKNVGPWWHGEGNHPRGNCGHEKCGCLGAGDQPNPSMFTLRSPYGVPGDRLWVREAWFPVDTSFRTPAKHEVRNGVAIAYRADADYHCDWNNPIFMPRWASRLTLEITEVRVQRVQEISEEDAIAEGCGLCDTGLECECGWLGWEDSTGVRRTDGDDWGFLCPKCGELTAHHPLDEQARMEYRKLWDSINAKKHPWANNPWVWCLTFRKVDQ